MSYKTAIVDFFKTWFLPVPAHDDPRFAAAQLESKIEHEPEMPDTSELESSTAETSVAPVDPLKPEEPVEQVYGEPPVMDPSIAEGMDDFMDDEDDEDYDPTADRDFAPGEPDENRDATSNVDYDAAEKNHADEPASNEDNAVVEKADVPVKKVKPLPAALPEAAEARASRSHSRVNPFSED